MPRLIVKNWQQIDGWLSPDEGAALQLIARGKTVLEIGSLLGRSTVCMASVASRVIAVDPHDGSAIRTKRKGQDTLPEFTANINAAGVADRITVIRSRVQDVTAWPVDSFDVVFIDGEHTEAACSRDLQIALSSLAPGGVIAVHDYGPRSPHPGVKPAVDKFCTMENFSLNLIHTLAILCRHPSQL